MYLGSGAKGDHHGRECPLPGGPCHLPRVPTSEVLKDLTGSRRREQLLLVLSVALCLSLMGHGAEWVSCRARASQPSDLD